MATIDIYDTALQLTFEERMVFTAERGDRHSYVSASPFNTRTTKASAKRRNRRQARAALRDPRTW